jgi:hypothetical protein
MTDLPQPNRDRRRKPDDEKTLRRLAEQYNAGASVRQLTSVTGWCYGTVHRRLHLAQVAGMITLRPRGGVTGPRNSG